MWKKQVEENFSLRREPSQNGGRALVGPSITVIGELAGEEDVVIDGRVEGTINFKNNNVTIGKRGRVKADIHAREIRVEGELEGDLFGSERVAVSSSGKVRGNIKAPRVVMEDGALFKGSVEMEPVAVTGKADKPRLAGGESAKVSNFNAEAGKLNTGSNG